MSCSDLVIIDDSLFVFFLVILFQDMIASFPDFGILEEGSLGFQRDDDLVSCRERYEEFFECFLALG